MHFLLLSLKTDGHSLLSLSLSVSLSLFLSVSLSLSLSLLETDWCSSRTILSFKSKACRHHGHAADTCTCTNAQAALLRGFARKRLKEQKGVYQPLMGDPEKDQDEEIEWSDEVSTTVCLCTATG
jgi:hypothetical protein